MVQLLALMIWNREDWTERRCNTERGNKNLIVETYVQRNLRSKILVNFCLKISVIKFVFVCFEIKYTNISMEYY